MNLRLVIDFEVAPVVFSSGISVMADSPVSVFLEGNIVQRSGIAMLRLY
jgi:hypothetical protein